MKPEQLYNKLYLWDFIEAVKGVFVYICKQDCDVYTVLDHFLASSVFTSLTRVGTNPKVLNMSSAQLIEVMQNGDGYDWRSTEKKEDVDWTIADWVAMVLTFFHWRFSIDFRDWLKYLSTRDVFKWYYPLHECGLVVTSDKLYGAYEHRNPNILHYELPELS